MRLLKSAGSSSCRLRLEGVIGTCRGSTPVLRPVDAAAEGDAEVQCEGLVLYIPEEHAHLVDSAVLDWETSFMGRGLSLTWPHSDACHCHSS